MSAPARGRKPASAVEMLVLRDRLGYKRYRRTSPRDPEKRRLLLEMGLEKIRKAERTNYTPIGPRKRRFSIPAR